MLKGYDMSYHHRAGWHTNRMRHSDDVSVVDRVNHYSSRPNWVTYMYSLLPFSRKVNCTEKCLAFFFRICLHTAMLFAGAGREFLLQAQHGKKELQNYNPAGDTSYLPWFTQTRLLTYKVKVDTTTYGLWKGKLFVKNVKSSKRKSNAVGFSEHCKDVTHKNAQIKYD